MIESRCGLLCSECKYREQMGCKGCVNIDKPFWGDACPLKSCCEGRKQEHCGSCPEFPCEVLNQFAYAEEEGDNGKRIEQCRQWQTQQQVKMKKEYSSVPQSMAQTETYGFSWMDFVTAIPSPLFVATSYKSNGKTNACLQSWACFSGDSKGFYAILSSVNKKGHLYQTIKEKSEVVLNFPSDDVYELCLATIKHNGFEDDEIALSGLTAKPASKVDAPVIEECFMNLECKYLWEREITENSPHVLMCLEVVNVCVDEQHLDETKQGRYGGNGLLYNIHYPINPEDFTGKSHDWIAVLTKYKDMGEY